MGTRAHKAPVWRYDPTKRRWQPSEPRATNYGQTQRQQTLRVVTYNIWFSPKHQPLRSDHLCRILKDSKADIICLQEVTSPILKKLISQPWIRQRYMLSDIDGRTFVNGPSSYGVVMLVDKHLELQHIGLHSFPTQQGRQLLFAEIQLRSEMILLGTVHLESIRKNERFRSDQLNICQSTFENFGRNRPNVTYLLMGDFNFDSDWPENAVQMDILHNWVDLWTTLRSPNDPGKTLGNVRFDRIMFDSSHIVPTQITMIGNKPIGRTPRKDMDYDSSRNPSVSAPRSQPKANIYPSDHFGLMADFDISYV